MGMSPFEAFLGVQPPPVLGNRSTGSPLCSITSAGAAALGEPLGPPCSRADSLEPACNPCFPGCLNVSVTVWQNVSIQRGEDLRSTVSEQKAEWEEWSEWNTFFPVYPWTPGTIPPTLYILHVVLKNKELSVCLRMTCQLTKMYVWTLYIYMLKCLKTSVSRQVDRAF